MTVRRLAQDCGIHRNTVKRLKESGWSDAQIKKVAKKGKRYHTRFNRAKRERLNRLIKKIEAENGRTIADILEALYRDLKSSKDVAAALNLSLRKLSDIEDIAHVKHNT